MLEALVALVVGLLIAAGVLVMFGSNVKASLIRLSRIRRPTQVPAVFQAARSRDVGPPALNPKTQRVLVAAARLASWLRAHAQEDVAREVRTAAARMNGNEPAGLHASHTALRRIRVVNIHDTVAQARLKGVVKGTECPCQDRL